MAAKKNGDPLKILSLFSGCGGLDLGFSGGFSFLHKNYPKLNTQVVFANDFDTDAATCYNSNKLLTKDGVNSICKDVREIATSEMPNFDIMLAGFPCQPFSNAGNRKGVNDDNGRGTLFEVCERVIKEKSEKGYKPKAFLFENVRGILSSKMADGKTTVPEEIRKRMEHLGYNVSMQLVCSSNYGVPQNRFRVLIIGVDKKLNKEFSFENLEETVTRYQIPSKDFGRQEKLLLGSILQDVPNDEIWEYTAATQRMIEQIGSCDNDLDFFRNDFRLEKIPDRLKEGRSWKDIPPNLLTPRFKKIYDNPQKYHSPKFFRRFALGEINGTITASSQPENCGITHPFEHRRFSVREIARIQSFPDNFDFKAIPLQSRYKVIGNAVPPVMAWVVAKTLTNLLEK